MKFIQRPFAFMLAWLLLAANLLVATAPASAAVLTTSYIRLNRMAAGTNTSLRVQFKATSAGATTLAIDFNGADTTTWTGQSGVVNATQTTATAACASETGDTALPGTLSSSGSGSTITTTGITALSAGTTYCVDYTSTSAVTTPTSVGEFHPTITAGSDSTTVAVRVVSGTNDQVVVNAVIGPTFNFVISGCASNIDNFTANLSAGAVTSTGGCTVTVNTNAKTGWYAWARDSNTGLTSTAASKTIASTTPGTNATLSAGTEGYVFGVTAIGQGTGAGTTSATNAYGNGSGGTAGAGQGSGLDSTLRLIASSTGSAASATLTTKEAAAINATTPAANDYTDTLTIVGAGNF